MSAGRAILYIASAAGVGLLIRSVLRGPVPLTVALGAFALYFVVAALGVFKPQLQMYTEIAWRGSRKRAEVALTFDDGPQPEHTRRILAILQRAGVKATFFVIGRKVDEHPEVAAEIVKQGHAIALHGHGHDRLLALRTAGRVVDDLLKTQEAVRKATGQVPMLFRPPVGITSPRIDEAVRKLGLTTVAWSVKGMDGIAGARADKVAWRIARKVRPGSIVLMHDALERSDGEPASVAALPAVLAAIHEKGLKVVPLEELLRE
jgi:peptidoglycan-N-acetylglucosamine deacetylase